MVIKSFLTTLITVCLLFSGMAQSQKTVVNDRQLWLNYLDKVARPVLSNLAQDQLKEKMPGVMADHIDNPESRAKVAYLEAFARTLSGIGPWLQLNGGNDAEIKLRNQYRKWALKAVGNAVNPQAKDYLQWNGGQPLVDASFMALAFIRCPWLWENLDQKTKEQVIIALKLTRNTVPVYSNWILFTGMIEAFFCRFNLDYDKIRIEYGVREFMQHWYVGDGFFSDGMQFHQDYYNSFVIQPYLTTIIEVANNKQKTYVKEASDLDKIGKRYAEIQERMINTDGSYPATGRSIVYRSGAFQHLANVALLKSLPVSLKPAQVRSALTAVIKKTLGAPSTFNANGWLNIGLSGNQPGLADVYITTGSLYLCSEIFLPLGLPDTDEFWQAKAEPWSAVKIWSGMDAPADHAMELRR
jgi:hypothetical protein